MSKGELHGAGRGHLIGSDIVRKSARHIGTEFGLLDLDQIHPKDHVPRINRGSIGPLVVLHGHCDHLVMVGIDGCRSQAEAAVEDRMAVIAEPVEGTVHQKLELFLIGRVKILAAEEWEYVVRLTPRLLCEGDGLAAASTLGDRCGDAPTGSHEERHHHGPQG